MTVPRVDDDWGNSQDAAQILKLREIKHRQFLKLSQIIVLGMLMVFIIFLLCAMNGKVDDVEKLLALVVPIVSFIIGRESAKEDS